MNKFEVKKLWDNSGQEMTVFSKTGMRAHLKIGDKYYILSQAWPMDTGYEIMLFAADEEGEIESFSDLWVTYDLQMDDAIQYLKNHPDVINHE